MLLIVHGTYTGISMHFMIVITFHQISHAFTDFTLCSGRFLYLVIFFELAGLSVGNITIPVLLCTSKGPCAVKALGASPPKG